AVRNASSGGGKRAGKQLGLCGVGHGQKKESDCAMQTHISVSGRIWINSLPNRVLGCGEPASRGRRCFAGEEKFHETFMSDGGRACARFWACSLRRGGTVGLDDVFLPRWTVQRGLPASARG